jgi:hypothetical protein
LLIAEGSHPSIFKRSGALFGKRLKQIALLQSKISNQQSKISFIPTPE